jgi:hypothetical protein
MTEWRTIDEFPEYQISEHGKMRRVSGGRYRAAILNGSVDIHGYVGFTFNRKHLPKAEKRKIHRLVALAFLGAQPSAAHEVAHIDGDKTNNHYTNLRWCTHIENEKDKINHGTLKAGETNHLSKLTSSDILLIRSEFANGVAIRQLADKMGVTFQNIWYIVHRQTWKHV